MTIEEFNVLEDHKKCELIFDAVKIFETIDNEANCQLFQIDSFYVETKTSFEGKFKRSVKTYSLKELPVNYAGEVLKMPIVKLDNIPESTESKPALKKKKSIL